MKQNIFKKLMLIAVLLTSNAVWAYDFEFGGIYYNITSSENKTVEVTIGDNKYTGSVIIPESVNHNNQNYSVTSIGSYAFDSCSGLTSVTIPNSVTSIGDSTFYFCRGLTSVTIGNSVTSIGDSTFSGCTSLTSVTIPNSVTRIGGYAFYECSNLTNVTIGNSVTSIDDYAFSGCSSLTSVTIPNSVTNIGKNAFSGCSGLTSVTIGNSVTSIGAGAFYSCTGLTYIELPSTITSIDYDAFGIDFDSNNYQYITRTIKCNAKTPPTLGGNVFPYNDLTLEVPFESIPDYQAVEGWTKNFSGSITYKLKEVDGIYYLPISETEAEVVSNPLNYTGDVVIPAEITVDEKKYKVTSIGNRAFYNCTDLTNVTIPESVTTIGSSAFYGCSNLKSIELPSTITSIGANACYNVSATFKVPFASALAYKAFDELKNKTFEGQNINGLYYLPTSETEVEVTLNPTKYSGDIVIPDTISVDSIKYKVTSIGYRAFYNCSNLTSIDIPESVSFIGPNAFVNCSSLTSLTIPSNVDYFDKHCCSGCSSLKTLIISDSEKGLDFGGFITPEEVWEELGGLPTINGWCFYGGDGSELFIDCPIDTLYIGRPIFSYSDGSDYNNDGYAALFASVSTIANVTLSDKLTSISDDLFKYCYKLTSITIPDSVTSIGCNAFYECTGLTSVTIGNSVTSIGGSAFYNCSGLTYIELPSTITSIGGSAFAISHYYYDENGNSNYRDNITRTIKCNAKTPPTLVNNVFHCNYLTLEVPFESIPEYKAVEAWTTMEDGSITYKSKEVDGIYYMPTSKSEVAVSYKEKVFKDGLGDIYTKKYIGEVIIPSEITVGEKTFKVTSIGDNAFYSCDSLTNVTIPKGVTSIGNSAFYGCTGLTYIELPSTITSIGGSAFAISDYYYDENGNYNYRGNITRTIKCNAKTPPTLGSNYVFAYNYLTLEVPFESIPDYKAVEAWTTMKYGSITYKSKEVDGIYYLPTSKTEVAVTYKDKNYNSYTSDVVIPDTIMVDSIKYNVTSIGERAFYNCNKLNGKVSLPSSIISIGEYAFSGTKYSICEISATTPPTISSSSLSAETSLVLVPKGTPNAYKEADVWKNYTIIAEGSCDIVVTNAKGGELARSIFTQTRKNLQNITGIKVKGTLNSIDLELINTNMSSLLHLDITETDVTEIPAEAFKNVVTLMSIKLPSTLQTIGDYAFSGCKVLSGELILPEKLTKIGNYAFQNCSGLSGTLKIPANVTYINSYAFSGCYNIKNIDMTGATKLYEIGNNAFRGCTTIENVDMAGASRLINLGTYVFSGCTGLKSVDMTGAKSLTSLSSYIFNGCNSLETVLFPETLETIGSYSFYNCAKLDNLKLPAALKSINSSAFNYCTGLKSIDMTEAKSMTSLTSYLFSDLYSLETVLFPETLETIGNNTFYNCTKLNNIKLPAALKSIDSSAFYGCTGMTTIDFSACTSLSTIYSSAFYGCTGLTMLDLLACESLITIKDSAFSGCSSLATINFPISLVSIGSNAFANCTNLLQLSVPCTIPPVIENHAEPFAGVDNIACILSIPSENFFDYYSANYWGGFVDVEGKSEVQNGVNDATVEEDGEGEGDSAGEGDETGKHKKHKGCKVRFKKHHKGGHSPRLMALKGVNTLAETEDVSNTSDLGFTGDGQSLFVGFGESVTYYLTPEEGKEIESVYFNDEDVTSQLVNNTLTVTVTSDMTMTSFVVNMKNASPKLAGDINGDGEVNVTDVVKLYSYILGNSTDINESVVDLNGDGEVNVSDIVKLYSIILSSN